MPEYLAPGVFLEEVSYRSKSIEGVSTTTTGFVGPARFGPATGVPALVTSLAEFEATYGDGVDLFGTPNYLWHAVRAFFEQGGKRLYVSRVIGAGAGAAEKKVGSTTFKGRHEGAYGDLVVTIRLVADLDAVHEYEPPAGGAKKRRVSGLRPHDVVLVGEDLREVELLSSGRLQVAKQGAAEAFFVDDVPAATSVRLVTASLDVAQQGRSIFSAARLALAKASAGASLEQCLTTDETGIAPITADKPWSDLVTALGDAVPGSDSVRKLLGADTTGQGVVATFQLEGGSDGNAPDEAAYAGTDAEPPTGLEALEHVPEISIVAAPAAAGSSGADLEAIIQSLITHAELMRYRVAVLDAPNDTLANVRAMRSRMDSTRAAIYYPWVTIADPAGPGTIDVPPSGYVAGIYARNDVERGVWKAPANEVVRGALRFSKPVNTARQEVLNPLGINCLRTFEMRGNRVWGARTISSDPEWKYLNVRRYFNYLERSIDISTQWAVFEPNGERLWGNVRRTIGDYLLNEFQSGALLGEKPEQSYFVRCDRSTMTQNDLDNGRLVCLIGVAVLKPAEFVIFRIGQWTADRRS